MERTVFYDRHVALGAKMVEFGGWEMPLHYTAGIVGEHLATRREAGLFDVSHMGRFIIRGRDARRFLQHVLSNNAEALDAGERGAQYTFIPTVTGGAVDDAYLYRFVEGEYLLVVNASNREKDWGHLQSLRASFPEAELQDATREIAMLALQGPASRRVLEGLIEKGRLPEPVRNAVNTVRIGGTEVRLARTGYTGEPVCFELFCAREHAAALWDVLVAAGSKPAGLGARDTLRLEAGLPLYGHELGVDAEGREIPVMACPIAPSAVSFSPLKGDFIGREALLRQHVALKGIMERDYTHRSDLPRRIRHLAVLGQGIARQGFKVHRGGKWAGYVTSGTMVPYWVSKGEGIDCCLTNEHRMRAIGLAYLDSEILDDERVTVEIRGRQVEALIVPFHLRSEAPPHSRPILAEHRLPAFPGPAVDAPCKARWLLEKTAANTRWRQQECINLIPSEMTASPMVRLLSVMDPAFRYAEHRPSKAFYDAEVFYYEGTEFIAEVERLLDEELRKFLGCREVELRLMSGQMANMAVFSALVEYLNRGDRRSEPRRMRCVMNHPILRGGHLSAQPMGALRDFVARDPHTERPAVVGIPVLADNHYQVDVPATLALIDRHRPELIVLGKSMVLHKEPVSEIRQFLDDQRIDAVLMYDMAHVLGLVGPHFQQPFAEGADLVTGSTHKTFFGTQRGVVGSRFEPREPRYALWEAVRFRTFPGFVSNHHLGTLLGLLMAAYEMNHFKDEYQAKVITNAKAFARALDECGLDVAGDPRIDFTETHQVVVRVGYGRGVELAARLARNNIICNFQASPDEESFTAAGSLRLGVAEMTRFGMQEEDFRELAELMRDVILRNSRVVARVKKLRERFRELRFCFRQEEFCDLMQQLHQLL